MAHILIVDDETDVRELFNITAKMAGHITHTAADGLEALHQLERQRPDLVLLDLMMPRLDGFGFLARVRTEMPDEPLRVLVATAKILDDEDRSNLRHWPVVGILNKGDLDVGQMMMLVRQALAKDPQKPDTQPPASAKATAAPPAAEAPPAAPAPTQPPAGEVAPPASGPAARSEDGQPAGSEPSAEKPGGAAPSPKEPPSQKEDGEPDPPRRKRRLFL